MISHLTGEGAADHHHVTQSNGRDSQMLLTTINTLQLLYIFTIRQKKY